MNEDLTPVRCGCGGEATVKKHTFYRALPLYSVKCDKCGIQVPSRNTEAEAITAWNRAMRRAKVDILPNTIEGKGPMPFCPHCGDELEWE